MLNSALNYCKNNWLALAAGLFVVAFFLSPSTKWLNNVFYTLILLPVVVGALTMIRYWPSYGLILKTYKWLWLFVATLLVSMLASQPGAAEIAKQLTRVLYIVGFLATIKWLVDHGEDALRRLFPWILTAVFLGALICIYLWYQAGFPERAEGFGITANSVRLGVIYGFAAIASGLLFLLSRGGASWLLLLAAIVCGCVLLTSQSRAPVLASVVVMAIGCVVFRGRRALFFALGGFIVGLAIVFHFHGSRFLSIESLRFAIWQHAIDIIKNQPWLGAGLHAPEAITVGKIVFEHPHGAFMTTLYLSGVIGLSALILLIITTIRDGLKQQGSALWLLLLLYGLIYMCFDGSRLFYHPRELWLVFWLPLGVLLAKAAPAISAETVSGSKSLGSADRPA